MGSEAKEMKYRRRARVPEPFDYGQCGGDRSGVLDWGALKENPVELLRKLDELRDHITRSCEITDQPRERHRMSRRTASLRPSHAEPPPLGRGPEHYRSRYTGRYGSGFPHSPNDQLHRSMHRDRYERQPSGRFRQWPERQWENSGYLGGNHHQSTCQCAQCLHGQRAVMQEEHIPMTRYFAGQQGSHLFDRSPSVSSELDRRSVASSLYSHFSVSKRRTEFFRKKAESFCRPVRGAAPFVVCSSCNQLLQLPPGKCTARKQIQVRCGSCSEIVSFKLKEVKIHPLVAPTSFPASKTVGSSSRQVNKSFGWYQHQDEGNSSFHKLQAQERWQQNKDLADNISVSSTSSYDRIDKECGSNRSSQLLSVSVRRSRLANIPKDILCQGDAYSQVETSAFNTGNLQAPVIEDKCVDPFSSRLKDCSGGDRTSKECSLNIMADSVDANVRDERSDVTYEQNSKDHKEGFGEETVSSRHEQKLKESTSGFCDDGSMGNIDKLTADNDDTSSLEDGDVSKKYEEKIKQDDNNFQSEFITERYSKCSKEDNNSVIQVETIATICKQDDLDDCYSELLSPNSEHAIMPSKLESSVNERTNSSSRVSSEAELDEVQSAATKNGDSKFFAGFLKKGLKDISLFNQSVDSAKVSINGHSISERVLRKAEKKSGPVGPGSYWYDYRAGFWGVMGHECSGIIPPFIKEFNYPMPKNCAGGNTGVIVNGRELHQKDFELLAGRGLPRISGKSYSVEINGNVIDETTGKKLRKLGKLAPTVEKLKRGFGMHVPEEKS
ncbi:uncharacterized protein [Oryza sativa Japonica Group]|uniref:Os05g0586400 protein n=3 Tax=Oryza TaxID=4527 RepID=B9FLU8_ORYSJ|nr:uncharacterized protein LOC4339757 [Oryza sativa Japonica Group]KAB8100799.1 hypothetical protein EE612_031418 [Oryza sativa]AAT44152.1 unknown protein [Oryza sativa Japonica Group]EEE64859.1 hypothetical protein OsJ_19716 [Oryza sativa Japonica Group]KAF2932341.1 hypothetical protein DAI22_05g280400 [Oryza sativa Japonica Group]BAF18375.1 Os05g0586400 [Oryza sativa Japonica Group]|eukprot:NP_001056461.1 Os05g0586400 [Oryza sativa Japonica Group]